MNPIKYAIDAVGGRTKAAGLIARTYQAVKKMEERGVLPRTEYVGTTKYAKILAENSDGKFTAEWLLNNARPN